MTNFQIIASIVVSLITAISATYFGLRRSKIDMNDSLLRWQEFQSDELDKLRSRLNKQDIEIKELKAHIRRQSSKISALVQISNDLLYSLVEHDIKTDITIDHIEKIANGG